MAKRVTREIFKSVYAVLKKKKIKSNITKKKKIQKNNLILISSKIVI